MNSGPSCGCIFVQSLLVCVQCAVHRAHTHTHTQQQQQKQQQQQQ
jgi:hypothetical protein